jgi:branched-chain amino acid transport system permease protein
VEVVETREPPEAAPALEPPRRELPITPVKLVVIAAFLVVVLVVLPWWLDSYWMQIMTSVVISTVVALGLGLLIGRVGMVSLCQFVLVAVGSWVALRFHYLWELPFPVLVVIAGVVTGLVGVLIGLPALRLSGLYLALITLMAAGGITVVLRSAQFPNGGDGFFGNSRAGGATSRLPRPTIAQGDIAYYRYCVVVAAIMFLLALWHVRGKAGRAWAAIRQSEATALAAGVRTTSYKLWAFALASFMAGIAGALLAGAPGGVNINQFPVQNSILLLAVVLMGGVFSLAGAIVAGLLQRLLPALLDDWGVSTEWLTILFGIGVIQVLLTAPGGLVEQVPKDLAKLVRAVSGLFRRRPASRKPEPVAPDGEPAAQAAEP